MSIRPVFRKIINFLKMLSKIEKWFKRNLVFIVFGVIFFGAIIVGLFI